MNTFSTVCAKIVLRVLTFSAALAGLMSHEPAQAQTLQVGKVWRYTLIEGSSLIEDTCLLCDPPLLIRPMHGTFDLVALDPNPLVARYMLTNISFEAGSADSTLYHVQGSGEWQIGGEVRVFQNVTLNVEINNGTGTKTCFFTNATDDVERSWPMFKVDLNQTNGTLTQTYTLTIAAAPLREIWFSPSTPFTSGTLPPSENAVSAGDLISNAGHVVKRNSELMGALGVMPTLGGDTGLDALAIQQHAEILFSIEQDVFSESLGELHHGDILSAKGSVFRRNSELLDAFGPQPTAGDSDAGLDAIWLQPNGEIYFSIRSNIFSKTLGVQLSRGDILSSKGQVIKSSKQLLAAFQLSPGSSDSNYGLDALYIWPGGEIWFSTESSFQSNQAGDVQAGDLLSDQGYIVMRNKDLLAGFAPLEKITDFGLDSLFIVTDLAEAAQPALGAISFLNGRIHLPWDGPGQVFQLESSPVVTGPYLPTGFIVPDLSYEQPVTDFAPGQNFYRLRQW